jgi:hypothetical protein
MQSYFAPPYFASAGFSIPSGTGRYEANAVQFVEVDAKSGRPLNPSVPDLGAAAPKPKPPEPPRRRLSILVPVQRAVGELAFERAEPGGEHAASRNNEVVPVGDHRSGTPWPRAKWFRSFDMTKAVGIEESSSGPRCYVIAARYKMETP